MRGEQKNAVKGGWSGGRVYSENIHQKSDFLLNNVKEVNVSSMIKEPSTKRSTKITSKSKSKSKATSLQRILRLTLQSKEELLDWFDHLIDFIIAHPHVIDQTMLLNVFSGFASTIIHTVQNTPKLSTEDAYAILRLSIVLYGVHENVIGSIGNFKYADDVEPRIGRQQRGGVVSLDRNDDLVRLDRNDDRVRLISFCNTVVRHCFKEARQSRKTPDWREHLFSSNMEFTDRGSTIFAYFSSRQTIKSTSASHLQNPSLFLFQYILICCLLEVYHVHIEELDVPKTFCACFRRKPNIVFPFSEFDLPIKTEIAWHNVENIPSNEIQELLVKSFVLYDEDEFFNMYIGHRLRLDGTVMYSVHEFLCEYIAQRVVHNHFEKFETYLNEWKKKVKNNTLSYPVKENNLRTMCQKFVGCMLHRRVHPESNPSSSSQEAMHASNIEERDLNQLRDELERMTKKPLNEKDSRLFRSMKKDYITKLLYVLSNVQAHEPSLITMCFVNLLNIPTMEESNMRPPSVENEDHTSLPGQVRTISPSRSVSSRDVITVPRASYLFGVLSTIPSFTTNLILSFGIVETCFHKKLFKTLDSVLTSPTCAFDFLYIAKYIPHIRLPIFSLTTMSSDEKLVKAPPSEENTMCDLKGSFAHSLLLSLTENGILLLELASTTYMHYNYDNLLPTQVSGISRGQGYVSTEIFSSRLKMLSNLFHRSLFALQTQDKELKDLMRNKEESIIKNLVKSWVESKTEDNLRNIFFYFETLPNDLNLMDTIHCVLQLLPPNERTEVFMKYLSLCSKQNKEIIVSVLETNEHLQNIYPMFMTYVKKLSIQRLSERIRFNVYVTRKKQKNPYVTTTRSHRNVLQLIHLYLQYAQLIMNDTVLTNTSIDIQPSLKRTLHNHLFVYHGISDAMSDAIKPFSSLYKTNIRDTLTFQDVNSYQDFMKDGYVFSGKVRYSNSSFVLLDPLRMLLNYNVSDYGLYVTQSNVFSYWNPLLHKLYVNVTGIRKLSDSNLLWKQILVHPHFFPSNVYMIDKLHKEDLSVGKNTLYDVHKSDFHDVYLEDFYGFLIDDLDAVHPHIQLYSEDKVKELHDSVYGPTRKYRIRINEKSTARVVIPPTIESVINDILKP